MGMPMFGREQSIAEVAGESGPAVQQVLRGDTAGPTSDTAATASDFLEQP